MVSFSKAGIVHTNMEVTHTMMVAHQSVASVPWRLRAAALLLAKRLWPLPVLTRGPAVS